MNLEVGFEVAGKGPLESKTKGRCKGRVEGNFPHCATLFCLVPYSRE